MKKFKPKVRSSTYAYNLFKKSSIYKEYLSANEFWIIIFHSTCAILSISLTSWEISFISIGVNIIVFKYDIWFDYHLVLSFPGLTCVIKQKIFSNIYS